LVIENDVLGSFFPIFSNEKASLTFSAPSLMYKSLKSLGSPLSLVNSGTTRRAFTAAAASFALVSPGFPGLNLSLSAATITPLGG
jgi:hypothetical protein